MFIEVTNRYNVRQLVNVNEIVNVIPNHDGDTSTDINTTRGCIGVQESYGDIKILLHILRNNDNKLIASFYNDDEDE